MYIAFSQVEECLERLRTFHPFFGNTFLVCKAAKLPIGRKIRFSINSQEEQFLRKYYKPDARSNYFYTPFKTSSRGWLSPKYPWAGSQKTRTQGDLARAFLHDRGTDSWGWSRDYVRVLREKLDRDKAGRVPLFWLAVWLYRNRQWPERTKPERLVESFLREFNISREEQHELFLTPLPKEISGPVLVEERYSDEALLGTIEPAPGASPEEGGTLRFLQLDGVGPSHQLGFVPAERLTIITGDNGLGKTFLLECAWWSLTGHWAEQPAYPRLDSSRNDPAITFEIAGKRRKPERTTVRYDWELHSWPAHRGRPTIPGLIVYARVDGSFAVWDPIRHSIDARLLPPAGRQGLLLFSRNDVLRGLEGKIEGLLRDWIRWQHAADKQVFETFKAVLRQLSPPDMSPLEPGDPERLAGEPRDIPTLLHSYGKTPFTQESAGIRRIVSIAYLLVWAWNEHLVSAALAKREPQQKMVILLDEMEAHLHPRWQRSVLPALLDVTKTLSLNVEPQMIVATHSPLVLASVETRFSDVTDKLIHLELTDEGTVNLSEIPFVRYGKIDSWLTSDIFALRQARSREGEIALEKAKQVMARKETRPEEIVSTHQELAKTLSEDDNFWPRWGYFLDKKGIKL